MMKNIKRFVEDVFGAFFFFVYEGLVIIGYVIGLVNDTIYKFFVKFVIPATIDILTELTRIIHFLHYELLHLLAVTFLKLSKLFSYLSSNFLKLAEEKSSKRVWF